MIPFDRNGRRFTVAVDFDGTLVEHRFPEVGPEIPGAVEGMRELAYLGCRIIIHSCRVGGPDSYPERMLDWLRGRRVPFDEIWRGRGKPFAHRYIDDRAVFWRPDWPTIMQEVKQAMVEMTGGVK